MLNNVYFMLYNIFFRETPILFRQFEGITPFFLGGFSIFNCALRTTMNARQAADAVALPSRQGVNHLDISHRTRRGTHSTMQTLGGIHPIWLITDAEIAIKRIHQPRLEPRHRAFNGFDRTASLGNAKRYLLDPLARRLHLAHCHIVSIDVKSGQ